MLETVLTVVLSEVIVAIGQTKAETVFLVVVVLGMLAKVVVKLLCVCLTLSAPVFVTATTLASTELTKAAT